MTEQLSISLGLEISYIYGTVNGEEATFSLTSPGVWTAIVPKAPNGKYIVSITAYNSLGTPSTVNTIIYSLDNLLDPKTNWTYLDAYNPDDLNRVEANIQKTLQELQFLRDDVGLGEIVVDRDYESIEFSESLNRIEGNIKALRDFFHSPPGWIEPKLTWEAHDPFSYVDANRLELNVKLLYEMIQKVKESLQYSGATICGDDTRIF